MRVDEDTVSNVRKGLSCNRPVGILQMLAAMRTTRVISTHQYCWQHATVLHAVQFDDDLMGKY